MDAESDGLFGQEAELSFEPQCPDRWNAEACNYFLDSWGAENRDQCEFVDPCLVMEETCLSTTHNFGESSISSGQSGPASNDHLVQHDFFLPQPNE